MPSKAKHWVDCSQPLHTPAGYIVRKMWYGSFLNVLKEHEYSGYPNNGPLHTLYLKLSDKDLFAFFDLVKEAFASDAAEEFIQAVMSQHATKPVRLV